jgi:predicted nucleic-acid-binding Zn-ribbon protein
MRDFVQATGHDINTHAKIQYLILHRFLKLISSRFGFYEFYRTQYRTKVNLVKLIA